MSWRLGVVGSPIVHSRSPQLHEIGLACAGLEGTSTRVELALADATQLRDILLTRFDALSVTSPLKFAAFELCDVRSEVAERTGSVNTLKVVDGRIWGESTDGAGFVDSLGAGFTTVVDGTYAVVLGAGGAATAIVDALVEGGATSVVVLGSDPSRVERLVGRYQNVVGSALVYRPVDLIVNTVPTAVRRNDTAVLQGVHRGTVAVDVTYDPPESAWRSLYETAGCRTTNGLAMLAHQAALQMNWWWGTSLRGDVLLETLR